MSTDIIRIAVMSDIHSNMAAFDACIADSKRFKCQHYLFLGDLISDWHQPNEVLKHVRKLSDKVICGNREKAIIKRRIGGFDGTWRLYNQFASMEWTYDKLSTDELDYIQNLPPQIRIPVNDRFSIRMVHGSAFSANELMFQKDGVDAVKPSFDVIEENILLFGHTHEQGKIEYGNKIAINPGSVGVHFNDKCMAEYAIIEIIGSRIEVYFRQIAYNFDKYFAQFCQTDLYEKDCVWFMINTLGMKSGHCYTEEFFKDIERERRISDLTTKGPVPNDIWNRVYDEKYSQKATKVLFNQ